MYIINITFAEETGNLQAVAKWLKELCIPIATGTDSGVIGSKLLKIVALPGDPEFLKEGTNLSLQLELPTSDLAHAWMEDYFSPILESYSDTFNRPALCFATILEEI